MALRMYGTLTQDGICKAWSGIVKPLSQWRSAQTAARSRWPATTRPRSSGMPARGSIVSPCTGTSRTLTALPLTPLATGF